MIQISVNLPLKRKLHLSLVKRREALEENNPLIPNMGKVFRAKKGSKVSRFFKLIFENNKVKRFFGANVALIIVASSILPSQISGSELKATDVSVTSQTPLSTEKAYRWPTDPVSITQGYHLFHPGYDLDGITGDPIYPIKNGVVESIQYSRFAYGDAVIINHGNGLTSLYAHLSKINVEKGQKVTTTDVIGEMGATGRAFGDHLHLEIRQDGYAINPGSVLPR